MPKTVDIFATRLPSFCVLTGASDRGEDWLNEHIGPERAAEHRYAPDILMGAHRDGLTVSLDGRLADAPRG
jgi:hypothetical protein